VRSVLLDPGQGREGDAVASIDHSENSTRGKPQRTGDSGDSGEKLDLSGWSVVRYSGEESKTGTWSVVGKSS
jgi:hypothetical protein